MTTRGGTPPRRSSPTCGDVFAGRLRSVVAYGPAVEGEDEAPLTCLALVDSLGVSDLEACAQLAHAVGAPRPGHAAHPAGRRSSAARSTRFRSNTAEIIRAHERVFGDDPFDGITISREDLRRACETQVKSHLVHLREASSRRGGRPQAIAELVAHVGAGVRGAAAQRGAAERRRLDGARRRHARGRARRRPPRRHRRPTCWRSSGRQRFRPTTTPRGSSRSTSPPWSSSRAPSTAWRA